MSVATIASQVRAGRVTAAETIARTLAALENCRDLNAVTHLHADRARARAEDIDRQVGTGKDPGPLAGVPFAVKNLFDVAGQITRAGSRATGRNAPADRDAFAIRSLEAAGAILIASTNMDELAYGFAGENAHDGDTRNPRDPALSAGGSSSGSSALVAAGAVPLALGTDTNGSVRVPTALSGVAGLKPTYGRLSRSGVTPFVRSLDHVGLFATDIHDLALAYDALQARDHNDPVQAPRPLEPAAPGVDTSMTIRTARLNGYFDAPLHPDVRTVTDMAAQALEARGPITLDLAEAARAASFILTTAEGGQHHLPGLITHPDRFGPLVRDRLRAGALVPAAWTARAQKLRRRVTRQLAALMRDHDILLAPATPCPACPLGTAEWEVAGVTLPIRLAIGMFTQALTLTGVPIAVLGQKGATSGLPVGVQIIGRPFEEATVLRAARRLEQAGFGMAPQMPEAIHA
ncbi:AtzE family amidohydrolase [Aestuariibius sp. 2305UL40-4]|uniref:AtzE family amidohydrolase n=1 Tax=Aestuariibius violaceus TaxID=3234132 RepID=UPI00345E50A3